MSKDKIPSSVRNTIWLKYIGESMIGLCTCCKQTQISNNCFECGHVISEKNGGTVTIDNLRPICSACNKSMGTLDMDEFMKKYGYIVPSNTYDFKKLSDQMLRIMCSWCRVVFDLNDMQRIYKQLAQKQYSDNICKFINTTNKYIVSCGIPKCVVCKMLFHDNNISCDCGTHWYYTDDVLDESTKCKICGCDDVIYYRNGFREHNTTQVSDDDNSINIKNIEELQKIATYMFSKSKVISCTVNEKTIDKLTYANILLSVIELCKDRVKNSKYMRFVKGDRHDSGYKYYNKLGISIQGADSNNTIKEILNQSVLNNIHVKMNIKTNDDEFCIMT